ncbi:MAG: hypothetical protein IKI97_14235 [Clostridia bacterium]|nr:hypothetical protein [Clostridia bacterium]
MKRTMYLISFLLCFLLSFLCISATLSGISSGADIGSIVILLILFVLLLLLGIFLCRKYKKQDKTDNSEFDIKVKTYHENYRPLNWFSWQVVILPIGIVLSIVTIFNNILMASATFTEPYKTATLLLSILDVVTVVLAARARVYAKELTEKSYKCFMTYYIYSPIPVLINTIAYIFLTLDLPEDVAGSIVGEYFGRFIALTIFSVLCIVYFKKRKNLFAETSRNSKDTIDKAEETENQQVTLFDVYDEPNEAKKPNIKKRFCKLCGAEIDYKTKKCNGCGKQYFKMVYGVILIVILLLILMVSVVAYKIGENQGYHEAETINESSTSSDWKESAKKSLEDRGYYENKTPETNPNNNVPSVPKNNSTYERKKRECLSALCENEVSGISSYCIEHKCQWPDCNFARNRGSYYCSTHTCNDTGCSNPVIANYKSYCQNHTCYYPGCTSGQSFNSIYCLRHK